MIFILKVIMIYSVLGKSRVVFVKKIRIKKNKLFKKEFLYF